MPAVHSSLCALQPGAHAPISASPASTAARSHSHLVARQVGLVEPQTASGLISPGFGVAAARFSSCLVVGIAAAIAGARPRLSKRGSRGRERHMAVHAIAPGDRDLARSLEERTLSSLDFEYVLWRLGENCYTTMAKGMAQDPKQLMGESVEEVRRLYQEVEELTRLEDADLQLEGSLDILQQIESCSMGTILEESQLRPVAEAVEELMRLRNGLEEAVGKGVPLTALLEIVEAIDLPDRLLDAMVGAFTEDGQLSDHKFPQLKELRERISSLEEKCSTGIRAVLASGKYVNYLTDDGYMHMGDRYCLSVKPRYVEKVGEALDASRTGRTVYVEPWELVEAGRQLRRSQQTLKFSIKSILSEMCVAISRSGERLRSCIEAAARIDLARGRLFLGEDIEGEIPEVRDEGVILARHARNACLMLRGGITVKGYRLELGTAVQGLMLSGPNAGGKTVVLKTVGLLALLTRCGIPVPAGESPRVDFFEVVLAEVGDMQTLVDDLSTYSAHLVASRIMMGTVSDHGNRSLILVDEAGTGTDPAQGAALARAVFESMLESGTRLVATTHSLQLKNWALEDPRTEVAAMEYKGGQPTFRLTRNSIGESHAVEVARRLGLPEKVVDRAEVLLGEDQRSLLALQRKAEELEKELAKKVKQATAREAEAVAALKKATQKEKEMQKQKDEVAAKESTLEARYEVENKKLLTEHEARIEMHKRKLEEIVQGLKRGAGKGDARLKIVGNSIEELQVERDKTAELAAEVNKQQTKRMVQAAKNNGPVRAGDWVTVLAKSAWNGFRGRVTQVLGDRIFVKLQGTGNRLELREYEISKTTAPTPVTQQVVRKKDPMAHFKRLRAY